VQRLARGQDRPSEVRAIEMDRADKFAPRRVWRGVKFVETLRREIGADRLAPVRSKQIEIRTPDWRRKGWPPRKMVREKRDRGDRRGRRRTDGPVCEIANGSRIAPPQVRNGAS